MKKRGLFDLIMSLFIIRDEQAIREEIDRYYKLLETETNEDMRRAYCEHINDLQIEWLGNN